MIIADDGIATGSTARAAIAAVEDAGASRIVLATPVAAADVVRQLRSAVSELICLESPSRFAAVAQAYEDSRRQRTKMSSSSSAPAPGITDLPAGRSLSKRRGCAEAMVGGKMSVAHLEQSEEPMLKITELLQPGQEPLWRLVKQVGIDDAVSVMEGAEQQWRWPRPDGQLPEPYAAAPAGERPWDVAALTRLRDAYAATWYLAGGHRGLPAARQGPPRPRRPR